MRHKDVPAPRTDILTLLYKFKWAGGGRCKQCNNNSTSSKAPVCSVGKRNYLTVDHVSGLCRSPVKINICSSTSCQDFTCVDVKAVVLSVNIVRQRSIFVKAMLRGSVQVFQAISASPKLCITKERVVVIACCCHIFFVEE